MQRGLPFRYKIIGSGVPDNKTQDLIDFSKKIPSEFTGKAKPMKLSMPDSAAITPALCRAFMDKAHCTGEDTVNSAKEKMMNCHFSAFEDAARDTYLFFFDGMKYYLTSFAVRSGDLGATGVNESKFICINTNTDSLAIEAIQNAAIEVLASTYSDDAKIMAPVFASLGSRGVGILSNTFLSSDLKTSDSGGASHESPSFTLSYLAPLPSSDYSIYQLFRGIAVKPNPDVYSWISFDSNSSSISNTGGIGTYLASVYFYSNYGLDLKSMKTAPFKPDIKHAPPPGDCAVLGEAFPHAFRQIRGKAKLHAELVCADAGKLLEWSVLQISFAEWLVAKAPYMLSYGKNWLKTDLVTGFAEKKTAGVLHAGKAPSPANRDYNKTHKNYLLAIDAKDLFDFTCNWNICDYNNAGAIALVVKNQANLVVSHFAGALRMLGIPVLVFKDGSKEAEKIAGLSEDAECNVFADEEARRGGVEPLAGTAKKRAFFFWPF